MFIESQHSAINSRKNNILLSASAGTGKTYTMVERILSLLAEGEDISSFLVLAFGNDASKEMKDRIEAGIAKMAKTDPKFFPQLKKLKIASISTIHSFALEVAKTYFAVSGASPKSKIMLGADADVAMATAMDKVFLDQYEQGGVEFLSLVEYFVKNRKDDLLKSQILKLYTFSRNMPKGEFEKAFFATLENQSLEKIYFEILKSKAESLLQGYVLPAPVLDIYQNQRAQLISILQGVINAKDFSEMQMSLCVEFAKKTSIRNPSAERESEKIANDNFYKTVRDKVKDFVYDSKDELSQISKSDDFSEKYREIATQLFHLATLFEEEFSLLKAKKDYLDFSDTEHMLHKVLLDEKSRAELSKRYKYVFCDEYQDVSKIQEEILVLLSQSGNLFTVGDIKQNIYGFRACDQSVIKNRENAIEQTGDGDLLRMNTNFRSHSDILEFVNCVFSASMTDPNICEYEKTSMFEAMANFPETGGVEIAICKKQPKKQAERGDVYSVIADKGSPREEQNAVSEGGYIAKFIKRYLGTQFDFPNGRRQVRLSDFAILLRKTSDTFAKTIQSTLEKNNIPSFILSSDSEFKIHTKVLFLADFLKTMSSPFDDVPLYSTLVSPFFDISDDVLFEIKKMGKGKFFYQCFFDFAGSVAKKYHLPVYPFTAENVDNPEFLVSEDNYNDIFSVNFESVLSLQAATNEEKAVAKFLTSFCKYRTIASVSAFEMLKTAISDNRVKEKITLSCGEAEWDFAEEFLKFIGSLENSTLENACEKIEKGLEKIKFTESARGANAVVIMTMHKSKGLEFPFTIIAGTGKMYNFSNAYDSIVFHKDFGIAFEKRDIERKIKASTIQKLALKNVITRDIASEEARLLYVALTRAKFKLLITGTLDCDFTIEDGCVVSQKLPTLACPQDFYTIKSHLKLILASLSASKYTCNHQIIRILQDENEEACEEVEYKKDNETAKLLAGKLLNFHKTNAVFPVIPTKFTATQRLENFSLKAEEEDLESLEKYEVSKILNFADKIQISDKKESENAKISKSELGTSYHKILEEIDFFKDESYISSFVEDMKSRGDIANTSYDIAKIFKLTNNELFQNITPKREVPFVMNMQSELFGLEKDHTVLCQGVIDCVFEKPDGTLILVDYKATQIKSSKILKDKYKPQLETYKIACEKILNKKVSECYIYSIFSEELVEITFEQE